MLDRLDRQGIRESGMSGLARNCILSDGRAATKRSTCLGCLFWFIEDGFDSYFCRSLAQSSWPRRQDIPKEYERRTLRGNRQEDKSRDVALFGYRRPFLLKPVLVDVQVQVHVHVMSLFTFTRKASLWDVFVVVIQRDVPSICSYYAIQGEHHGAGGSEEGSKRETCRFGRPREEDEQR